MFQQKTPFQLCWFKPLKLFIFFILLRHIPKYSLMKNEPAPSEYVDCEAGWARILSPGVVLSFLTLLCHPFVTKEQLRIRSWTSRAIGKLWLPSIYLISEMSAVWPINNRALADILICLTSCCCSIFFESWQLKNFCRFKMKHYVWCVQASKFKI